MEKKQYNTPEEIKMLREQFIEKYTSLKGWNKNSLTEEQLMEIQSQKQYKTPMILS